MGILLQPLGPFILAILTGLTAGYVGTIRDSVVAFAGTVIAGAVIVGLLDLLANAKASWHGGADGSDGLGAPMAGIVWDQVSANLVVVGVVGGLTYLTLRLI